MAVTTPPRKVASEGSRVRPLVSPRLARLTSLRPRRRLLGYAVATGGSVALTLSFLPIRNDITPLSKGFGFLVIVVIAAAVGGLWPGILASFLGFLSFNFFFLPPYGTFVIARAEDVGVLFVFLGLSILISALLARAAERAEAAEAREAELQTLQALSAQLVAAVPGPETYQSILSRLVEAFGFSAGSLFVQDAKARQLVERVTVGASSGDLSPRWDPATDEHPPERLPLSVGGHNLGLLVLRGARPLAPAESRVLRAFCDQFALVLERDRLLRTATEAEVYRQSDNVRRSLLAAVSHDLRTPLAAIKASVTDLLGEDTEQGAEYSREALETINKETDRLASLVANLLDMSRIEGGMLKARVQPVDLTEVLATCIDRIERQWPRLRIRMGTNDQTSVVRADPVFMDRVLTNLLDNAAKAAGESGTEQIELESERSDGRVVVRVIDHGPGVPESVREQLFYPFYQVSERHPRLGTGLGLAIAKGFLVLMNGEIWIEDTPGGGATFAFSLPAGGDR
ncbi:MAG TPA: ATP-binding protein [Actinomycetota bacterium]|nr:ATP-binding protein [Actinomycetota bacterium]